MPLALDLNGGGELSSVTHRGVSFTDVSSDMVFGDDGSWGVVFAVVVCRRR